LFVNIDEFSEIDRAVEYFAIEYGSQAEWARLLPTAEIEPRWIEPVTTEEKNNMAEEKTYLELSEADGVSHKFYEVIVKDAEVTIRYGRIGDRGQTQTKTYPSADKAKADATKKINEKLRKGYEAAVMGVRQKRPVTRRQIVSNRSTAKQAPVLWKFASGSSAFGIFIDSQRCWVGNQDGRIFVLDGNGQVLNQYRLPDGVKCIVADDDWIYAGCDNGNVYDLSGKVPRVAYEIAPDVDIFWLDIKDGVLGISDAGGRIAIVNHEDESQWMKQSSGSSGWMVRCDEIGVYHGHSNGVTMYDWEDGRSVWQQKTDGAVLFGWQEEGTVYAGTSSNKVYAFTKKGKSSQVYQCDAAVYSCAAAEDGKYVFAGDNYSSIYCFNETGDRLWKLGTGCGSAFSMQFLSDRLYIVTTDGSLAAIDASEAAISAAQAGNIPQAIDIKAPKTEVPLPSATLETATDTGQGVIVECIQDGAKLRIRVVSPGYNSNWNVQFPKDIRQAGGRYLVEELRESARGGFYRTFGDIKKIE
jgi:predicted DNA-binding WGR domain protein